MDRSKIIPTRIKVRDLISALPDCLLVEIISRLPTIKTAIRTGTLSKRWKFLWTSVHNLIFEDYGRNLPPSQFVLLVDKTLSQCCQSKLGKFAITTRYDIHFESQFNKWICYATSRNVEKLDLRFYGSPLDSDWLNEDFFTNSNFTDLRLSSCLFNPKGAISWKRLRNLFIYHGGIDYDVDVIKKILSGCPLLETLLLNEHYCSLQLDITSGEIKKLVFSNYTGESQTQTQTQINNVLLYSINSNVEKLDLDFYVEAEADFSAEFLLNEYFFINSCLTNLKLQGCIFDTEVTISWKKLRRLCISYGDLDEDTIENILSGSPLLETLELEDCYGHKQLDITSKSVKNLVISRYHNRNDEFEIANVINAPDILSLTIQGCLYLWKLLLLPSTMPSLVEVNLDFHEKYEPPYYAPPTLEEVELAEEEIFKGFIRRFCHVKELKIMKYYDKGSHKQAMLEKYRQDMLKYQNAMIASISEEVCLFLYLRRFVYSLLCIMLLYEDTTIKKKKPKNGTWTSRTRSNSGHATSRAGTIKRKNSRIGT